MDRNIRIAEKIVKKLLENPNKFIWFKINGIKKGFRFDKSGDYKKSDLWIVNKRGIMTNLVFFYNTKKFNNLGCFYESFCKSKIALAVAKEFINQVHYKYDYKSYLIY